MKTRYIREPVHGNIAYNKIEEKILCSRLFNRLHHITQNSTTFFTFPATKHTRHLHSIGTMHLASQFLRNSLLNSREEDIKDFLGIFEKEIELNLVELMNDILQGKEQLDATTVKYVSLHQKEITLISLPIEEMCDINYYNIDIPRECKTSYIVLLQLVRLSALLHDIGHPPFSHLVEWSMSYIFASTEDKPTKSQREEDFCKKYNDLNLGSIQMHEKLGLIISKNILQYGVIDSLNSNSNLTLLIHLLQKMLEKVFTEQPSHDSSLHYKNIHYIVDGIVDVDRLDYVKRDSYFSGYKAASFDLDRIIHGCILLKNEDVFEFVFEGKILGDIQSFLISRFKLYNDVLFHHNVQKTNTILNLTLVEMGIDYLNDATKIPTPQSQKLPTNIEGLWHLLEINNPFMVQNLFSQYDENWLITVLKESYFELQLKASPELKHIKMLDGLEDVLFGDNHFLPLWKNKTQFCAFFNISPERYPEIYTKLTTYSKNLESNLKGLIRNFEAEDFLMYFAMNRFKNGLTSGKLCNVAFEKDRTVNIQEIRDLCGISHILTSIAMDNVPFYFYYNKKNGDGTKLALIEEKIREVIGTFVDE